MALFFCSGDSMNCLVGAGDLEVGGTVGSKVGKIWSEQTVLSVEVGLGRGCKLLGSEKPLEVLRSGNGEISVLVHVLVALELGENEVRRAIGRLMP